MKGVGNQQDYGMRIYDPRVGKFLSVDPLTPNYPMLTPYQYASGNPVAGVDEDGLEFRFFSLKNAPGSDGRSHLCVDKQVGVSDRTIKTTITINGIPHPTLSTYPQMTTGPIIVGVTDEWKTSFETKMSDIRLSPVVVSPDGKAWRVLPDKYDIDDLPDLDDQVWTSFETPEEFIARKIAQAQKGLSDATSLAQSINIVNGILADVRPARYQGPKPTYHVNEKHVKLRRGQNATRLPDDAEDVFKNAVPDDINKPKHWYGKNKDGAIYRFSSSNNGKAHFSGRSDEGDGLPHITDYAIERLKDIESKH